jgi:peptidoglycan/LPS O-acetylase OafA/YrhL
MPRFVAIEGLRAWLAWAVVAWHLVQFTGLARDDGPMSWFAAMGDAGVMVFIAISGFVIAGLVTDKAEPYPQYIIRRAFRIFPVYLVILAIAFAALPLGIWAGDHAPWAGDPTFYYDDVLHGWDDTVAGRPVQQAMLHLTLMQGVVPDSIWPNTSTAVLGPAWSLSLEWQFYLVAPVLVWLVANPRFRMATVGAVALMGLAWHFDLFGDYMAPSFLPAAAYVFLIGIVCRMNFERIRAMAIGPEVIPLLLALGVIYRDVLWLSIWAAALVYLARSDAWRIAQGRPHWIAATMDKLFASPLAVYLGARSYSVYLVHMPMMMLVAWLMTENVTLAETPARLVVMGGALLATLVVSDVLYRLVERPMIALGSKAAARLARRRQPAMQPAE